MGREHRLRVDSKLRLKLSQCGEEGWLLRWDPTPVVVAEAAAVAGAAAMEGARK